jgi:putative salt-induced outer membrane protein YdiY
MKLVLTSLLGLICIAGSGYADVATLKNGDRVTGTLVTIKGGNLDLKTDKLGEVTIPVAQVATYSATKPVAVLVKAQSPLKGTFEIDSSGQWQVTTNGTAQTLKPADVLLIMPQDAYETLFGANPAPWHAWKGTASLGYSLQNGNQRTNTLTTVVSAIRERPETPIFEPHWRSNFGFTTLLSHAQEDGSTITSHTLSANLREDYLLTSDNFLFVVGQANHVSTQGLYLQQTYGGGYGRDIIKNTHTTFSIAGGPTYVQEKFFDGQLTKTLEALINETLGEQFTKRIRLDHNLTFYPDLLNGGQYRFDTTTSLSCKLTNKFAVNATAIDLFLSNPPAGNQRNNITLSIGIGYSFQN